MTNCFNGKIVEIEQQYQDYFTCDMGVILNCFRGLMHTKLINTDLLKRGTGGRPFLFDVKSKIEDMVFTLSVLREVKSVCFCSDTGYYYRRDNQTSLTKVIDGWTYEQKLYDWRLIFSYYLEICKSCNIDPASLEKRRVIIGGTISSVIDSLYSGDLCQKERINHLQNDFQIHEIYFLKFCHYSPITCYRYKLLLNSHLVAFDIMSEFAKFCSEVKNNIKKVLSIL